MKVGDKVICINPRSGRLTKGGFYTIESIRYSEGGMLLGLRNTPGEYFASRFELVDRYPFKKFRRNLP